MGLPSSLIRSHAWGGRSVCRPLLRLLRVVIRSISVVVACHCYSGHDALALLSLVIVTSNEVNRHAM